MSNLARLYETQARYDAAEEMLRESLKGNTSEIEH
jgi:hypothetical protein